MVNIGENKYKAKEFRPKNSRYFFSIIGRYGYTAKEAENTK